MEQAPPAAVLRGKHMAGLFQLLQAAQSLRNNHAYSRIERKYTFGLA